MCSENKALNSCAVTAQLSELTCTFVFVQAKIRFSHDAAHFFFTSNVIGSFSCSVANFSTR